MNPRPGMWELTGAGVAAGGTGVWLLSLAARVGVLRAVLDLFPRATWDAVTWALIPALFLAPVAAQGLVVAAMAGPRGGAWRRAVAGAIAGSVVALAAIGAVLLLGIRRLPHGTQVWVGRSAPETLIVAFSAVILAGWLVVAARLARLRRGRWAILPVAIAAVLIAWVRAHHAVVVLSYVLDRPETNGFFAAVAIGGGIGSACAVRVGLEPAPAVRENNRRRVEVSHGV